MTRSTVDAKFLRKIQINWSGGDEEDESKPTPTVNAFSSSEFSHFSKRTICCPSSEPPPCWETRRPCPTVESEKQPRWP
ncbi:hypothetical protein KGM_205712 [Danaus plexippus plexippus]|uniref:Uncharacterized protein n=1 Tax=Danaus plexippus plexippus TaxID=278856 RepID=A0A212FEI8_DANPL|nr:hypothetical protein KGM_205712 [Danaus plexippus plexippus]